MLYTKFNKISHKFKNPLMQCVYSFKKNTKQKFPDLKKKPMIFLRAKT